MTRSLRLLATFFFSANALAAGSYDWQFSAGGTRTMPQGKNGGFENPNLPGTTIDLDFQNGAGLSFDLARKLTPHWALELAASAPIDHEMKFEHGLEDDETLGFIGATDRITPILNLQYHFRPDARIQPYVGAGVHYSFFFNTRTEGPLEGRTAEFENGWGWGVQVGLGIALSERWFANFSARYLRLSSRLDVDGEKLTDVPIHPRLFSGHIGYRF